MSACWRLRTLKVVIANFGKSTPRELDFRAAWARYTRPAKPERRCTLFEQSIDWGFHIYALGVHLLDQGLADEVEFWDYSSERSTSYHSNGILRVWFHDERDLRAYVDRFGPPDLFINHGPGGQSILDLLEGKSFRVHVPALRLGRDKRGNFGAECYLVDSKDALDARSMLYVPVVNTRQIYPDKSKKERDFLYLAIAHGGKRQDLLLNAVRGTALTGHLHPVDGATLDLSGTNVTTSNWNERSVLELLRTSRIAVYPGDETSNPAAMWECVAAGLPIVMNQEICGGKHLVVSGVTGELARGSEFCDAMIHVLEHRNSYRPREYFEEHWDTVTLLERYLSFFRKMGWQGKHGGMTTAGTVRRFIADRLRVWHRPEPVEWKPRMPVVSHDAPEHFRERFAAAGYHARHFFPHRVHRLPKPGPDGARLAERMCGIRDPDRLWQIVMFALPPAVDEFPAALFFDRDVIWHQQHFSRLGQVASVDLAADGATLYTMVHQSDLVQRISRRRDYKTRVESVFKGWHHLLLNAVLGFAADRGFRTVRVPTAQFAMEHTDPKRQVGPELFERIYDRAVSSHVRATESGRWWAIDVATNRGTIVSLERREEERRHGKTLCVCHDIERGYGHRDVDAEFARQADLEAPAALDAMLAIERDAGVRATYNVVGRLLPEVRERIERDGHCIAFHSYDHVIGHDQLAPCRVVDYRIKGYRAPQSVLTPELRDQSMCWQNFEWLASSAFSFQARLPKLQHRVAKIPITVDDYPLHTGAMDFDALRRTILETIRQEDFVAFSLHDCYASHWLPHYRDFLKELTSIAGMRIRTLDDVASDLFLGAGV